MIHRLAAMLAACALLLTLAAPVFAGGWAEIVADAQTTEPHVEGKPVDIGFVVLQHGVTPAPWETATVQFLNASTGKSLDVVATNDRADGHFVATVTLPEAGYWSWKVTLQNLESEHLPVALRVMTASGELPGFNPQAAVNASDLSARFNAEIQRLDNALVAEQAKSDRILKQVNDITAERDQLATRLAAAEDAGGVPLLGILMLSILAGATAGFAMTWLAGRPGPTVKVSPTPRGADPA